MLLLNSVYGLIA